MIQALRTAALRLPELRNKILLTIMILLIYQFGTHIPVLGVNKVALEAVLNNQTAGGFINVLNLLSGGAVKNFSVLANGVYPYITASIIFNLLTPIIPALEAMQREPGGQEKIQRYTYFLAIPMAVLQSLAQVGIFTALANGQQIIPGFGSDILLTASVIITMTAGTMFAVWLGELITEQGIGNGTSLIIFSGIVATAPTNLLNLLAGNPDRAIYNIVLFVLIVVVSVLVIIYIQEGVRRIPVQYGRRVRGNKQYQMGRDSHIPMKVNPVGMIPLIFSQSIITFPALIIGLFQPEPGTFLWQIQNTLGNHQGALYWIIFFLMTVAFTFFYADVMVGNYKLAETLQRNGGFIPGIRPGKKTDDYILAVTRRITIVGALFLGIIAVVPGIVDLINSVVFPLEAAASTSNNPALVLSGSGLIIVVGVVIETMRQLEAQLVMRNYEGFMS
jgi:preprotein translocase subunit SecY